MQAVTADNFAAEVGNSTVPVIVDFWATWCPPCKMLKPVLEQIASENPNVKVVTVNIDENQDLANQYKVSALPTILIFKEAKETQRFVGFQPKDKLLAAVQ